MAASRLSGRTFARQFATAAAHDAHGGDPGKTADMWKNCFYFLAIPAIILGHINCYLKTKEEEANYKRPPFVKYDCLNIRTKRYPWGDGTRTLFHNPHTNPLPTGWEDEH